MSSNLATMKRRPGGTNLTTAKRREYSTAFSPTSIAGCQLWLDGADPAGNGVIPLPGSILTTWVDKSGLGNNGTGVNSPTYLSTQAVNFVRSSSQYFTLPNGALPFGNSSYAYFIVATVNDNTVRSGFIGGGSFGSSGLVTGLRTESGSTNALVQYWWGNDMTSPNNVWSTNVRFMSGWFYNTGSTFSTWVNGTQVVSGNPGTRSQPNTGNAVGVTNGSEIMSGTISEIIVYGAALLNTTQKQTIESYLAQKWGLTGALPAGHSQFTQPAGKPNTVTYPIVGIFREPYSLPPGLILNVNSANYTNSSTIADSITGTSWNMTSVSYNATRRTIDLTSSGYLLYNNGGAGSPSFNATVNTQIIIYYRVGNSTNPVGGIAAGGGLFNINRSASFADNESVMYENSYWDYSSSVGGYCIQLYPTTNIDGAVGWVMRAFVKNGARGTFYLNGQPNGTTTATTTATLGNAFICIGRDYRDSRNYLNGEVAWAGMWNVALTDAQIAAFYNAYSPSYGSFVP